jgi:hypothetical protein
MSLIFREHMKNKNIEKKHKGTLIIRFLFEKIDYFAINCFLFEGIRIKNNV